MGERAGIAALTESAPARGESEGDCQAREMNESAGRWLVTGKP